MIKEMLEQLAELQSALDLIMLRKADLIDGILTPEIKAQMAAVDLEYAPLLEVAHTKISDIETKIKAAVIEHGATVKGSRAQAVFAKDAYCGTPRHWTATLWDSLRCWHSAQWEAPALRFAAP